MTWNPVVAGRELDLYVLYHEVCRQGGVEAVIKGKRWKRVRFSAHLPLQSHTKPHDAQGTGDNCAGASADMHKRRVHAQEELLPVAVCL